MDEMMRIMATRGRPFSDKIELHCGLFSTTRSSIAKPLEFVDIPEGSISPPFLTLDTKEAQELMDNLWHCGLRPSEGSGSAGSLRATEKHLDSMKKIAFHVLKINE